MDNFYFKWILIICIYIIAQYLYKKVPWGPKGKTKWANKNVIKIDAFLETTIKKSLEHVLIFFLTVICIFPFAFAAMSLYFIVVEGGIKFISEKDNWLQIVLISGYIILYFAIRISLDGKREDNEKSKKTIEIQNRRIMELEDKVKKIKRES